MKVARLAIDSFYLVLISSLWNESDHPPVFSLHNEHIMSVRKGDWKLFVRKPRGYRVYDLTTWKDRRAPDGTTILARMKGQATPAQYPGFIPENSKTQLIKR